MFKQIFSVLKSPLSNTLSKLLHQPVLLRKINYTQVKNISTNKCWKCGVFKNTADLFCTKCGVIQSPEQTDNYFKLFGLNSKYDLNLGELSEKYRNMQKLLHPDKFSNKSKEEKELSAEYSSLVNKAYSTLQTPLNRALHLLSLNNETISEDDKASDAKFLMEIMELNEEIDEAKTIESLKTLNKKNADKYLTLVKVVAEHFNNFKLQDAKETIIKMKYYNSILVRINHLLREKGAVD